MNDPVIADSIIASGKADVAIMGRASMTDPDMPNKAKEGRFDDIVQCIACLIGCTGRIDEQLAGTVRAESKNGPGKRVRDYACQRQEESVYRRRWPGRHGSGHCGGAARS